MSDFKGTPGPWRYSDTWGDVKAGSGRLIAELIVNGDQDANGNLVAAAPELLEACLRMRNQLQAAGYEAEKGSMNPTKCLLAQVEESITKALGQ